MLAMSLTVYDIAFWRKYEMNMSLLSTMLIELPKYSLTLSSSIKVGISSELISRISIELLMFSCLGV